MFPTGGNRAEVQRSGLHQRIVLRGRVNICADARDGAFVCSQTRHAEVSDLNYLAIGSQQQVLRFYVAVNHAVLVRVSQAGTNLLQIKQSLLERQRIAARKGSHVATRKIFEDDVVKRCAGQIDCSAVTEPANDIWMTHAIKRYCFVLKVLYQRVFECFVRSVL